MTESETDGAVKSAASGLPKPDPAELSIIAVQRILPGSPHASLRGDRFEEPQKTRSPKYRNAIRASESEKVFRVYITAEVLA